MIYEIFKIMSSLTGSELGMIHLLSSLIATFFGSLVLIMKKGTQNHIRAGYLYAVSMAILLATAFMIYRLFGHFGIFHIAAMVSTFTLMGGMIPVIRKKPRKKWLEIHIAFMYWSVFGLYAAFVSEVLTRVPETPFFGMVGLATFGVMVIGFAFFSRYRSSWRKVRKSEI